MAAMFVGCGVCCEMGVWVLLSQGFHSNECNYKGLKKYNVN